MRRNAKLAWSMVAVSFPALALAQAAPNAGEGAATTTANDRTVVEEIVVTAERREANLQSVPIAVSALTQAAIESQGIRSVADIAAQVPNLTATTGPQGSADANFFIRGVGQFDFIATNDPGVGVYVDGVYLGRTVGALLDAGDIGRVEVLRGPQGTLFGRNTLGGAVSVTSVAPDTRAFGARGRLTLGSRDRFDADLGLNAPLGDTAAVRLYGFTRSQDGFARNAISGSVFGATERVGGKAQLLWKPTGGLTVTLSADYVNDKSNPAPSVLRAIAPLPFFPAGAFAQTQDPNDFYKSFASNSAKSANEIYGFSGTIAYDFGDATLKSITAYRHLDALSTSDPDGTSFRIYDQQSPTRQNQFSQELQLTGRALDDRLSYVVGGYYFRERVDQTLFLCFAPITPPPTAFFNPCNTWNQGNNQLTESYAAFGQARFNLTEKFSVTVGGRYTSEDKSIVSNQAFDFRPAGFSPAPGIVVPGFLAPIVTDLADQVAFQRFTPKAGIEWKPAPRTLVFASYAQGFRSGGFNGRLIVTPPPPQRIPSYRPDKTDAVELGLKTDLFDRRLRANLTVFYTKYTDIQQTISVPVIQFAVANAGEAELYGFEAELTAVPVERLRLNASVGYSHSEFQRGAGDPSPANSPVDIRTGIAYGNALPFSPQWTAAIGAEYGVDLGFGTVTPRVDWRYQSRTHFTAFNLPLETEDGYGLWQARITLTDRSDRFSLAVFGDNLTDAKYYTFGQDALGAQGVAYSYIGRPREFGVTLGAKF